MTVRVVASDLGVLPSSRISRRSSSKPRIPACPPRRSSGTSMTVTARSAVRVTSGSVDESLRSVVRRAGREKRRLRARSGTRLVEPCRRLSTELDRE